jgi:hypothetical protein
MGEHVSPEIQLQGNNREELATIFSGLGLETKERNRRGLPRNLLLRRATHRRGGRSGCAKVFSRESKDFAFAFVYFPSTVRRKKKERFD